MALSLLLSFVYFSKAKNCTIDNCIECSNPSSLFCLQCIETYRISKSGCIYSHDDRFTGIENCIEHSKMDSCTLCKEGYHIIEGYCQANCNNPGMCFYPYEFETDMFNQTNSSSSRNKSEFFRKHEDCIDHCKECSGSHSCDECESGYKYNSTSESCEKESKLPLWSIILIVVSVVIVNIIIAICCVKNKEKLKEECLKYYDHNPQRNGQDRINVNQQLSQRVIIRESNPHVKAFEIPIDNDHQKYYPNLVADDKNLEGFMKNYPPAVNHFRLQDNPDGIEKPSCSDIDIHLKIRKRNFFDLVQLVTLDEKRMYEEQDACSICSKNFKFKHEIRILPCNHAFHGKCVYHSIITEKKRFCPICEQKY